MIVDYPTRKMSTNFMKSNTRVIIDLIDKRFSHTIKQKTEFYRRNPSFSPLNFIFHVKDKSLLEMLPQLQV
jgi:hypothetical protein